MNWNQSKLKSFLTNPYTLLGLFLLIGLAAALFKISADRHNNFLIFRGVYDHLVSGLSLYAEYPEEYFDINHYGPFFSLIIAPFAVVPVWLGLILWNVALAALLYWADKEYSSLNFKLSNNRAPLGLRTFNFIVWFTANELYTALSMQQFNVAIVALVILSFVFVEKGKDEWATLCVVLGTMTKLYGIVALPFFFFSNHKGRYIWTLIAWTALCFVLPMLISSPEYVIGQYQEWWFNLTGKNEGNALALMQNISLLGMIRKIGFAVSGGATLWATYSDLWVLSPACVLFAITFFRVAQWKNIAYRQTILASVLMMICLFSTGTESSGYIIALTGVVIWYTAAPWRRNGLDIALLVFAFLLTSMSPTDIFPPIVRKTYIIPYALKAFPVALIWFKLIYEQLTHTYEDSIRRQEVLS